MKQAVFIIQGMDCAEEVRALKQTVGVLSGVVTLDFNLLNAAMTVHCEDDVTAAQIIRAVEAAGLKAQLKPKSGYDEPSSGNRTREWLCGISGALTAGGFLAQGSFSGLPAALYTAAALTGGWFIFPKAWSALRHLRADMNLLMTLAVGGALILGEWMEAAAVTFLFSLAQLLETWSMERARKAIRSLLHLAPPTARFVDASTPEGRLAPVEEASAGTIISIWPGERIPLDGVIVRGETTVNQAPITGESMPLSRREGDEIFAGSINEAGAIEARVTRPASDTTLARIIRMVEEAQSRRAPTERWVDQFARYYTPSMLALSLAIAAVPPLFFSASWSEWVYQALVILVIACPCALVISTPVSIVAGLTAAARHGILIKGGAHLEKAAHIQAMALDKTGTLTRGQPEVQDIAPLNGHSRQELLERAAALEMNSSHPLAGAIHRAAEAEGIRAPAIAGFRDLKGRGVEAIFNGKDFWLGSHRLVHEKGVETPEVHQRAEAMEDAGHSVIIIGNERHVCGLISVADTLRPEAADAIRALRAAGLRQVVMLTGDNEGTAQSIAEKTGLDAFHAELLPEDKLAAIRDLQARYGPTAMVGDGINDAPALAASDLGIAMGAAGSDAAIETADIALMSDDLAKIPWMIRHARLTLRTIRQNIVFALGLKAAFMILALAGAATLWMAIAADMGASILVIFNGLRLLKDQQIRANRPK